MEFRSVKGWFVALTLQSFADRPVPSHAPGICKC